MYDLTSVVEAARLAGAINTSIDIRYRKTIMKEVISYEST